jgi:acyl carrier protein
MNLSDKNEFCALIERALELEPGSITMETKSEEVQEWDSLGHLTVLMEIRSSFGDGYVEDPNLANSTTVQELYDLVSHNF